MKMFGPLAAALVFAATLGAATPASAQGGPPPSTTPFCVALAGLIPNPGTLNSLCKKFEKAMESFASGDFEKAQHQLELFQTYFQKAIERLTTP